MTLLRKARGQGGFTLIEVMASLLVFGLMTLGVVPLLLSSIRGSALSRSFAVGKNIGTLSMERIRGLPYFISYTAQPRRVDVLDLYFPASTGLTTGQSYSGGVFTTVCNSGTSANPACPKNMLPGYTVRFTAEFLKPAPTGNGFVSEAPSAGYLWTSGVGADVPPTQLLRVGVITTWSASNLTRTFRLTTLLSDRRFEGVKVSGDARVEYGVQVLTGYQHGGTTSSLTARAGESESSIGTRQVSTATQSVTAGSIKLVEDSEEGEGSATVLDEVTGAQVAYDAPPDQTLGSTSAAADVITHPLLTNSPIVAGLDGTTATTPMEVKVANEVPIAKGAFSYSTNPLIEDLWVNSQTDYSSLQLDPSLHVFSLQPRSAQGEQGVAGSTNVTTAALGTASRSVTATATVTVNDLRLLPTVIPGAPAPVLSIDTLTATTQCKSTAVGTSATVSATWSATVRYIRDTANNSAPGPWQTVSLNLTGSSASDALAALEQPANNPLIYDSAPDSNDIYLVAEGGRKGYFTDLGSLHNVSTTGVSKDVLGQTTGADIKGAIHVSTANTSASVAGSGLSVSIGSVGCQAVDKR
jgi:prepilin-type N-terminal cleavage/methylation domain-containing protein